jgi:hypothetical protein
LSGYTLTSKFKKHYSSSNSKVITVSLDQPSNGVISIHVTPTISNNVEPGRYVWDILSVDGSNNYTRLIEGILTLKAKVT